MNVAPVGQPLVPAAIPKADCWASWDTSILELIEGVLTPLPVRRRIPGAVGC